MSLRGGVIVSLVLILLGTSLTAPSAASGSEPLLIKDPEGDAGALPCSRATDLLRFSAEWGDEGVLLTYDFRDLSAIETPAGLAQDPTGSCFWSYTRFVAEFDGGDLADSVYIDHNSNPLFQTGWRFYLHESRSELPAEVEDDQIRVTIPYDIVGQPVTGDRIGDFRIQVSNSADSLALTYQTDWAPDDSRSCGCWLSYNGS